MTQIFFWLSDSRSCDKERVFELKPLNKNVYEWSSTNRLTRVCVQTVDAIANELADEFKLD